MLRVPPLRRLSVYKIINTVIIRLLMIEKVVRRKKKKFKHTIVKPILARNLKKKLIQI